MKSTVKMVKGAVETLTVKRDVMLKRAMENYATATELADTLAKETGLLFRTAHRIVGLLVAQAVKDGVKPYELKART